MCPIIRCLHRPLPLSLSLATTVCWSIRRRNFDDSQFNNTNENWACLAVSGAHDCQCAARRRTRAHMRSAHASLQPLRARKHLFRSFSVRRRQRSYAISPRCMQRRYYLGRLRSRLAAEDEQSTCSMRCRRAHTHMRVQSQWVRMCVFMLQSAG